MNEYFILVFLMLLSLGTIILVSFCKEYATVEHKARLIESACGLPDAEEYVRKILARKNLQARHCRDATKQIDRMVKNAENKWIVERFQSSPHAENRSAKVAKS
jgi:hypothetical protein